VIFVVIVGIAAVVGFGYWMYRQMGVSTTTTQDPAPIFEEARAPFSGQQPYIEMSLENNEERALVHHELEKPEKSTVNRLRVLIYDPGDNRLVRLQIPFWLVRLGGSDKHISFDAGDVHGVRLSITPSDLERRGPGLILDQETRRGQRLLVWAE
jgi:hypothetical protein